MIPVSESTNPPNTLGDVIFRDVESPPASKGLVDLVHAIAAGDHPALRALYQRSHRIVFTLIMRITTIEKSAEEVTLTCFTSVWRERRSTSCRRPVIGWILNQHGSRAIDRVAIDPDEAFAVAEQRGGENRVDGADHARARGDRDRVSFQS